MSEIQKLSIGNDKIAKDLKTKYKKVKINKMMVNGKEQGGNVISAEDTKEKQELNVTVYTQKADDTSKTEKESS